MPANFKKCQTRIQEDTDYNVYMRDSMLGSKIDSHAIETFFFVSKLNEHFSTFL